MEPLIGQVLLFAGNFAPRGWALCNGQIMSIAQNTALFSILGTTYGGDGQTTFALPDLRGRVAMNPGQGPGLSLRTLGQKGGSENVTLIANQMPAHTHTLNASNGSADTGTATGKSLANSNGSFAGDPLTVNAYNSQAPNVSLNAVSIGASGGSQPHDNMPPFLAINYIIALEGIFPTRE